MESSSAIPDPEGSINTRQQTRRRRRTRKKIESSSSSSSSSDSRSGNPSHDDGGGGIGERFSWRSEKTERVYSTRLFRALRDARLNPPPTSSSPRRGRAVREAADRALAVSARGRSRWSRAILSSRMRLKFMTRKRKRDRSVTSPPLDRKMKMNRKKKRVKVMPAVQRKARFLGRLVPGCKKETLPVILEEAGDYIEALEMQIRAMTVLAEMLSRSGTISEVGSSSGGGGGDRGGSGETPAS